MSKGYRYTEDWGLPIDLIFAHMLLHTSLGSIHAEAAIGAVIATGMVLL